MILLNPRYFGMIVVCQNCGAVLGYKVEDVSRQQTVPCLRCGNRCPVPFDPTYDGLVKEKEK